MKIYWLVVAVLLGLGSAAYPVDRPAPVASEAKGGGAEGICPAEDLMREHGVLRRIFLIYEELISRENTGRDFSWEAALKAAGIVKSFIEDYHEKLEEEFLFPRFREKGDRAGLAAILQRQHESGRALTADIIARCTPGQTRDRAATRAVTNNMRRFIRQYRPHAAREDTELFPALREVFSRAEIAALGRRFEEREDKLFGPGGFESVVAEVAKLEQLLGINDLSRFTVPLPDER